MIVEIRSKRDRKILETIDLPESTREVKLNQYIDFVCTERDERLAGTNPLMALVKAVSSFTGADLEALARASLGEETASLESGDILPLYHHITSNLLNHKPQIREQVETFLYNGEELEVPYILKTLNGFEEPKDLSLIEVIEIEETRRALIGSQDENGNVTASQWYSDYLTVLAVLLRPPGVELPTDDIKRENFIKERRRFFKDIDFGTALDMDFFLTNTLSGLEDNLGVIGSLMKSLVNIAVQVGMLDNLLLSPGVKPKKRLKGQAYGGRSRPSLKKGLLKKVE